MLFCKKRIPIGRKMSPYGSNLAKKKCPILQKKGTYTLPPGVGQIIYLPINNTAALVSKSVNIQFLT